MPDEVSPEGQKPTDSGQAGNPAEAPKEIEISPELEAAFERILQKISHRDLVSRRIQVRDTWEQRYFWRGNQWLGDGAYGQWAWAGEGVAFSAQGGDDGEEQIDETNIYQAYGLQLLGVLTQNNPTVRFFPVSNKSQ